jgi:hypothetical protein
MPALRPGLTEYRPLLQSSTLPRYHLQGIWTSSIACTPSSRAILCGLCLESQIFSSTVKIDNLVCTAFGLRTDESRPEARLRSHQQHFLARAIANNLEIAN